MSRDDIVLSVEVGDGKYTVQQDRKGRLTALRYGEPWRDCCGDGLILTLAQEVSGLRAKIKRMANSDFLIGQRVILNNSEIGQIVKPENEALPNDDCNLWVYAPSKGFASRYSRANIKPLTSGQL